MLLHCIIILKLNFHQAILSEVKTSGNGLVSGVDCMVDV